MSRFDLYDSKTYGVEELRLCLESALDLSFALHESSYTGGDYYLYTSDNGEKISIKPNSIDDEGYRLENDYKDTKVLLYISNSNRWEKIEQELKKIMGLNLLKSELIN